MSNTINEIFKAYDIRGKIGTELNEEVIKNIGRVFADWLPAEGPVAVGYDMRPDSESFSNAIIEGLQMQGRDVWNIGQVTTDMVYFSVGNYGLAGGVMITASHNPGDYNGIKLCREEAKPVGADTGLLEIRDLLIKNTYSSKQPGIILQKDVAEGWVNHVLDFIDTEKLDNFKIAVDAGNGMAGKIFPEIEPFLPFETFEMYFDLDGTFPNHIANPLEEKNLVDIIKTIKENKLDAGIAFDGDGDRAVLIDELGRPVSGTVMTAILADYFLDKYPRATILYNAICGNVVPQTIANKGGTGIRTKVGHSYIKSDMSSNNAVFAGEHSGHYYFKDNWNADSGLIAAIIALYVLSKSGVKLSTLADRYSWGQSIQETNLEVENKDAAIQAVAEAFPNAKKDHLDGLTLTFEDGWLNVRPSNTEPLLRLNAEAQNLEILNPIVDKAKQAIATQQSRS